MTDIRQIFEKYVSRMADGEDPQGKTNGVIFETNFDRMEKDLRELLTGKPIPLKDAHITVWEDDKWRTEACKTCGATSYTFKDTDMLWGTMNEEDKN